VGPNQAITVGPNGVDIPKLVLDAGLALGRINILFGGLAGEMARAGQVGMGCQGDVEEAEQLARFLHLAGLVDDPDRLLHERRELAIATVAANRSQVERLAAALVDRVRITRADALELLSTGPDDDPSLRAAT